MAASPQTFTVTNTNDSGAGSLRQAILNANATVGTLDTIAFNISGIGPHSVALLSGLPIITDPLIIDGTTQPGFSGAPIIELNGNGVAGSGFSVTACNTTIRGLVINRFGGSGIAISPNGGNVVEGNFIGTDVTGTLARPNGAHGVAMTSSNNRIGGRRPQPGT